MRSSCPTFACVDDNKVALGRLNASIAIPLAKPLARQNAANALTTSGPMQPIQPPTEASCDQHDGDARSAELVGARLHHRAADGPQWLAFAVILRRDHIGVMQSYASIPENAGIAAGRLSLRVTPHGHLVCEPAGTTLEMDKVVAARVSEAFGQGSGYGLLQLGAGEVGQALPPVFIWWRGFATRYVAALCQRGTGMTTGGSATEAIPDVAAPSEAELAELVLTAPMMAGAEYLSPDVLRALWAGMAQAVAASLAAAGTDLQSFLKARTRPGTWSAACISIWRKTAATRTRPSPSWRPTRRGSRPRQGTASAAGRGAARIRRSANRRQTALAAPAGAARRRDTVLGCKPMVDAGEIFHPLRWTPAGGVALLPDRRRSSKAPA